ALAGETARSLEQMAEMVNSVKLIVDNIAVSAREQAQTVYEINKGMETINGSIQGNSAAAGKNAEYSKELSDQFERLNKIINRFTFK
ncbi:MAG: methyl-accepting chemotaxis protein, partial [Ruminococcus sp.]|nr:methyl-accepting chemotaxis protein [Ruminococcus sp.]